jgi:hypothetical protein
MVHQLPPEVSPENSILSEALGRILFSPENLKFSQALWRKSHPLKVVNFFEPLERKWGESRWSNGWIGEESILGEHKNRITPGVSCPPAGVQV